LRGTVNWPRARLEVGLTQLLQENSMPEISNQTLVIAIQAVATDIRTLREALAGGEAEP